MGRNIENYAWFYLFRGLGLPREVIVGFSGELASEATVRFEGCSYA